MAPIIPWDELIRRFDPWSPLSADEIPTFYVARPSTPLAQLDQYLLPRHRSSRVLLAGQRSSGKTTELRSLMPRFGQDYLVIMVDISEPLKRSDTTMEDLLYNLGRMIFVAGETGFPGRMDRQLYLDLHFSMGSAMERWVSKRAAAIKVPELIKTGAVLLAGLAAGPVAARIGEAAGEQAIKAFQLTPEELTETDKTVKLSPLLEDVARSVSAIIQHLENEVANREVLLLVDGLDLLPPDSTRALFRDARHLAGLPCRTAIVAPFEVFFAVGYPAKQYFPVVHFPNVYVSTERHLGADPESGLAFFRDVFQKRLPATLDSGQIIEPSLSDRLARSSGGVVRDFITLVQLACHVAERGKLRVLDDDAVQAAEEWLQRNYRAKLNTRVIEILRDVQRTKIQPESPLVPELVFETLMVSYSHRGHVWWETHPALGKL
jgi:Cdc6-like AAA superfamily ATPase